jgi:hypothetical protein
VLARPHTSSPWAAEGRVVAIEMDSGCVGGGDGRRECVEQQRAVAAVRGGVACRFLEWSVCRLSSQLALR